MKELYALCSSWADESSAEEVRCIAAEAYGWLDPESEEIEEGGAKRLREALTVDSVKSVRDIAQNSWIEYQERTWAKEYLSVIKELTGQSNEDLIAVWCFGDALSEIGDDFTIKALEKHLNQGSHLLHLRFWLNRIINNTKANWRKKTNKWPDPWFGFEGEIERGRGQAITSDEKIEDIEYSVWRLFGRVPADLHNWGGAMWSDSLRVGQDFTKITLEDGRQAEILITVQSDELLVFRAMGKFPE